MIIDSILLIYIISSSVFFIYKKFIDDRTSNAHFQLIQFEILNINDKLFVLLEHSNLTDEYVKKVRKIDEEKDTLINKFEKKLS